MAARLDLTAATVPGPRNPQETEERQTAQDSARR